jgi:hypothetical protein
VDLVTVGVDIGQRIDPTAIVVAEAPAEAHGAFVVRHLERLSLGTPYPRVAERVAEVAHQLEERARGSDLWLVLDATGVGRPVVDLVREALGKTRFRVSAATFTATDRLEGGSRSKELKVGKAWLVSRLQALLQTGRIHLPETAEARALASELTTYEIRVSDHASVLAGAFKTGAHDDLVTALGLAVLESGRRTIQIGQAFAAVNASLERHPDSQLVEPTDYEGW